MVADDWKDAREWGARSARDILKKKSPKTVKERAGVRKTLLNHVEKTFHVFSPKWKDEWKKAAFEVLLSYENEHKLSR